MTIIQTLSAYLQTGLGSLASYLAAHVLLCLLRAFFIAGALAALMPKEAITRFLGKDTPKYISYPAAALGGFVLAVCSCTIMPLFAGIYKKGAGIGPAITFLFVGRLSTPGNFIYRGEDRHGYRPGTFGLSILLGIFDRLDHGLVVPRR